MSEPKKETVRIALPPRPESTTPSASEIKRDTARIVLPSRTPVTPIRRSPPKITPLPPAAETPPVAPRVQPVAPPNPSPLLQPLPKPPGGDNGGEAVRPVPPVRDEPSSAPMVNRGPKKETARIAVLPRPTPAGPAPVNMTKTQPLLVQPVPSTPIAAIAPVVLTSRPVAPVETISRPLCWALFATSALIFLIQIWNYVVS